jgi:hypothetical protein
VVVLRWAGPIDVHPGRAGATTEDAYGA